MPKLNLSPSRKFGRISLFATTVFTILIWIRSYYSVAELQIPEISGQRWKIISDRGSLLVNNDPTRKSEIAAWGVHESNRLKAIEQLKQQEEELKIVIEKARLDSSLEEWKAIWNKRESNWNEQNRLNDFYTDSAPRIGEKFEYSVRLVYVLSIEISIMIAHPLLSRMTTRKLPKNVCRNCGYDLRASRVRCSECGKEI